MIDENILIDRLHDNKETKMNISVPIGYYDVARRAWDACIKKVCKLIEEQQRIDTWIPCSERLPESFSKVVLVCLKNGAVSVAICCTDGEFINMMVGASRQKFRYFPEHNPVIAWQPLPEAYHE